MKHVALLSALILSFSFIGNAQSKKEQDQKAIKDMCGCYEVGFNFAETFQYSKDTAYVPSKVKHDKALEWVELVEDGENKIVMQHLLLVGRPASPKIIKHWRQDWLFENTDLYTYNGDNVWNYKNLPKKEVKGQWTQKVFQVDDSPRYEGSATWVHVDGKSTWENTAYAPLPRREYTTRNDYNVTIRTNKHAITKEGWIHDQDNDKIIRKNDSDVLLAQEKGYNTYKKIDDDRCKAGKAWWKENNNEWSLVRAKWDGLFARNKTLQLKEKVDGKHLYEYLFSEEFSDSKENIDRTIQSFVAE